MLGAPALPLRFLGAVGAGGVQVSPGTLLPGRGSSRAGARWPPPSPPPSPRPRPQLRKPSPPPLPVAWRDPGTQLLPLGSSAARGLAVRAGPAQNRPRRACGPGRRESCACFTDERTEAQGGSPACWPARRPPVRAGQAGTRGRLSAPASSRFLPRKPPPSGPALRQSSACFAFFSFCFFFFCSLGQMGWGGQRSRAAGPRVTPGPPPPARPPPAPRPHGRPRLPVGGTVWGSTRGPRGRGSCRVPERRWPPADRTVAARGA